PTSTPPPRLSPLPLPDALPICPAGLPAQPLLPQFAHLVSAAQAFRHQRERSVVPGAERFERIDEKPDAHPANLDTIRRGRLPAQIGRAHVELQSLRHLVCRLLL